MASAARYTRELAYWSGRAVEVGEVGGRWETYLRKLCGSVSASTHSTREKGPGNPEAWVSFEGRRPS